ncbi:unnamed protein product [Choristocarpus tenellus]
MAWVDACPVNSETSVVLGDQDVQETLNRLGAEMTLGKELMLKGNWAALLGLGIGSGMLSTGGGEEQPGGEVEVLGVKTPPPPMAGIEDDLRMLRLALCGPPGRQWPESLNVLQALLENPEVQCRL